MIPATPCDLSRSHVSLAARMYDLPKATSANAYWLKISIRDSMHPRMQLIKGQELVVGRVEHKPDERPDGLQNGNHQRAKADRPKRGCGRTPQRAQKRRWRRLPLGGIVCCHHGPCNRNVLHVPNDLRAPVEREQQVDHQPKLACALHPVRQRRRHGDNPDDDPQYEDDQHGGREHKGGRMVKDPGGRGPQL